MRPKIPQRSHQVMTQSLTVSGRSRGFRETKMRFAIANAIMLCQMLRIMRHPFMIFDRFA